MAEPFYAYCEDYSKKDPESHVVLSHVLAEGDLVVLHLKSKADKKARGLAVVDMFWLESRRLSNIGMQSRCARENCQWQYDVVTDKEIYSLRTC